MHFLSLSHDPADRALSAAWIGLVGRRGPRSKQPFMVTFFRTSQIPCRPPRALKPNPRKKKHKYDLPVPSIHGTLIYIAMVTDFSSGGYPSFISESVISKLFNQLNKGGKSSAVRYNSF